MELIRQKYIDKLIEWLKIRDIKILTGIRRVGKSTLLRQFIEFLKNKKDVLFFQIIDKYDFNNIKTLKNTTWENMMDDVKRIISSNPTKKHYLFIDEVQELKDWQKAIKTLLEDRTIDIDIYLTGSNSQALSMDLGTWFTGRHLDLLVLPFTFKEIVNSNILQKSDNEIFQHYLYHGAIGKIIPIYENSSNIKELLKQISIDCIQKDVFKRYKIRNKNEFLKIVNFIYDQIGKKISINNVIDDFYKSKKIVYTYKTISDYIEKLENANLIKTLPYYDLKGRKIITSSLKIYSTDLGILSQNTTYSGNRSWRIENLVFLELLNRYDEVYTYKTYNGKEIDFICLKEGRITYLQVTDILNESNWEREVGNLESLSDSNEKIVLSNNVDTHYLSSGIKIVNLLEWLKS